MKQTSSLKQLMVFSLSITLFFTSCQKEKSSRSATLPEKEQQEILLFTQSETDAQSTFDGIFDNVIGVNAELGFGGTGIFGRTSDQNSTSKVDSMFRCAAITITPLQVGIFPKTVTMDFGTGCFIRGHMRLGKITTVYTGRLTEPGKSAITTFENFTIDSIRVEGTYKITNTTAPGSNQPLFKTEIIDGKLIKANGSVKEWNAIRSYTHIEGKGTLLPADDVFSITGNSSGKVSYGSQNISWTSGIKVPLIKHFSCSWISKGLIQTVRSSIATTSQWTATLDFGDGACDNKATLTVNGNVYQIVLR